LSNQNTSEMWSDTQRSDRNIYIPETFDVENELLCSVYTSQLCNLCRTYFFHWTSCLCDLHNIQSYSWKGLQANPLSFYLAKDYGYVPSAKFIH